MTTITARNGKTYKVDGPAYLDLKGIERIPAFVVKDGKVTGYRSNVAVHDVTSTSGLTVTTVHPYSHRSGRVTVRRTEPKPRPALTPARRTVLLYTATTA